MTRSCGSYNDVLYVESGLANLTSIETIDGGAGYDRIVAPRVTTVWTSPAIPSPALKGSKVVRATTR